MKTTILAMIMLSLATIGCGSKKEAPAPSAPETVKFEPHRGIMSAVTAPKAKVYRMRGNATAANVPIAISPSGNGKVVSYPDPVDVTGREPLELADGYLLDRRGIGANTVFTKWTYAEYAALKQAPDTAELKAAIIPGSGIEDIHILDMTLSEALADTAAVNRVIRKF